MTPFSTLTQWPSAPRAASTLPTLVPEWIGGGASVKASLRCNCRAHSVAAMSQLRHFQCPRDDA